MYQEVLYKYFVLDRWSSWYVDKKIDFIKSIYKTNSFIQSIVSYYQLSKSTMSAPTISTMIEWNTEELRSDLIAKSEHHMMYMNSNGQGQELPTFGILRIEVPIIPISTQSLAILLNLDHSGSMDDPCADGRTKMQHIKHTIKNILRVLMLKLDETPELEIYMCIDIFSHNVENILHDSQDTLGDGFIQITKPSVKFIIDEVERIVPWGCTNIELSLKSAQNKISTFKQNYPEFRVAHIQLTDGQATMGKSIPEDLKTWVDTSYRNIFVGYGEDHDGHLMASLGELSPMCEYKFVDIIENTGLVYGEILYNLLYPLYDSVVHLTVSEGAKIYDWCTNQWVQNMVIPPLAGNSEKIFQMVADGSVPTDEICVDMCVNIDERLFETAMSLPRLVCAETGNLVPNDLTLFMLRQLTQEHLYMVREFENERVGGIANRGIQKPLLRRQTAYVDMDDTHLMDIPPELEIKHRHIKNALLEHFHELSVYHESFMGGDDEKNCTFLKVLMDDMYVAIQNMGTKHGLMYTAARQTSQGRQSSYIPNGKGTKGTEETVDLYGKTDDQEYNLSDNTNTPYMNRDVMSMMTQVQGFETDMYISDTESENTHFECDQELPGEHLLRPDIGYDNRDVFNPDYYFDKLPIVYQDEEEIEITYSDDLP